MTFGSSYNDPSIYVAYSIAVSAYISFGSTYVVVLQQSFEKIRCHQSAPGVAVRQRLDLKFIQEWS